MKIAIIADSPLLTTGFGIEAFHVASALSEASHDVVCFGLKGSKEDEDDSISLPYRIWHIDISSRWDITLQNFFKQEKPEVVIILIDIFNLLEIMSYCNAASWKGPTIVYLTPDGIPAYEKYIAPLRQIQKCVVTTHTCAEYLRNCGIKVSAIASAGVDKQVFKELNNRKILREKAGLKNKFIVGVFGRNYERKQQPRILEALADLRNNNKIDDIVAYFHCNKRGYWHLDEIATELGIQNIIFFPDEFSDEARGVSTHNNTNNEQLETNSKDTIEEIIRIPNYYSYVERINICDVIINAAHCGDFEHIIIESQSCGIPLVHTNDEGIMKEAVGAGGMFLATKDVIWGKTGQKIYMTCSKSIADSVLSIKRDEALRKKLIINGIENARKYSWASLRSTMVKLVEDF